MWAVPVGFLALVCQVIDQLILKVGGIGPWKAGGGWVMFQTWALWFLVYYMLGGASAYDAGKSPGNLTVIVMGFCGYIVGIIAAICIFELAGLIGKVTAFWSVPIALFVVCIPALYWGWSVNPIGINPALFLGAATFFCAMSYFGDREGAFKPDTGKWARYGQTALGELVFCAIGLPCGWLTLALGEGLMAWCGVAG
jgi:hypothetical protein